MTSKVGFTVLIPTLNEESTVAQVVRQALDAGAERVLVLDGGSTDCSRSTASASGAEVLTVDDLAPGGPSLGKGDSLWRGLAEVDTEVVVFLDADLDLPGAAFFDALLAPLLSDRVIFSKANFTRLRANSGVAETGRVTTLVARPLLSTLYPQLAGFDEPLSGQIAAPLEMLTGLPFDVDYGLELGMLIDVFNRFGLDSIAHPFCGTLTHSSQSDSSLAVMAEQVMRAGLTRAGFDRTGTGTEGSSRPPHRS